MPFTDNGKAADAAGRPQPIKEILAELITRRGYAREQEYRRHGDLDRLRNSTDGLRLRYHRLTLIRSVRPAAAR